MGQLLMGQLLMGQLLMGSFILISCDVRSPGILIYYGPGDILLPTATEIPVYLDLISRLKDEGMLQITYQTTTRVIFEVKK